MPALPTLTETQKKYAYTDETDMLNVVLFGKTAKEWRTQNPELIGNMRDYATRLQLTILANMEYYNSIMIKDKLPQSVRMERLRETAQQ